MTSLWQLLKQNPIPTLKTFLVCFAFLVVGLQGSILGPPLLDLQTLVGHEAYWKVTWIVSGRGLGFAIGSALAGVLENKSNLQVTMACALIISGIFYIPLAINRILWVSIFCGTLAGISQGIIDTTCNLIVLSIWSTECAPFMQAVISCWSLGSFIAPILVRPYLLVRPDLDIIDDTINSTVTTLAPLVENNVTTVYSADDVQLTIPFAITAAFSIGVGMLFIYMYCKYPVTTCVIKTNSSPSNPVARQTSKLSIRGTRTTSISLPKPDVINHGNRNTMQVVDPSSSKNRNWPKIWVVVNVSMLTFAFAGVEQNIGTYIPSFAKKSKLKLDEKSGALVAAIFYACFTGFQLITIPIINRIGTTCQLWFNLVNGVLASILFLFSTTDKYILFISSAWLGFSYASSWGALFAFMEIRFPVTGLIVSTLTVTSCLGQSVFVALIGTLLETNPESFLWFIMIGNIAMISFFAITYLICRAKLPIKG